MLKIATDTNARKGTETETIYRSASFSSVINNCFQQKFDTTKKIHSSIINFLLTCNIYFQDTTITYIWLVAFYTYKFLSKRMHGVGGAVNITNVRETKRKNGRDSELTSNVYLLLLSNISLC